MNILTVLKTGGEYNELHVEWLQRQIGLPIYCLTDSKEKMGGVISIKMKHDYSGWWSKMEMFSPDVKIGDFLYIDLDTVIIRPPEFELKETTVLSDMYGGEHINSGLMFIKNKDRAAIWKAWEKDAEKHMKKFGGDQDFLDQFWNGKQRFQDVLPRKVLSYKADLLGERRGYRGDLNTAHIVCFHGQPRPWDVKAEWIPTL